MRRCLLLSIGLSLLVSVAPTPAAQQTQQTPSLDYELFKTRMEPIFLARRPGHARCYACHALGAGEGNAPNAAHGYRESRLLARPLTQRA